VVDIDPHADIQVHCHDDQSTISIPLTESVDKVWYRRYETLAQAGKLPAVVSQHSGQAWIRITVPIDLDRTELLAMMDAARALIAETTAEVGPSPAAAATEAVVRDWWSRQRV
jgi:hypothetical protein